MPYWFWGQKVKGQGHGAWLFENGFRTITDSVINQWSWNFIHLLTMSQGCALLILRSRGQRSRSWRMVISPPPVKLEGTIGLHSVCPSVSLSVRQSVCLSHSFSGLFLAMLSHILMKVGRKLLYEELQIKFDFRHGWLTFSWVIALY